MAIVVGSAVIAIGGGGIQPMRSRWESALDKWDEEKPQARQEMQGANERISQRAQDLKAKAQTDSADGVGSRSQSARKQSPKTYDKRSELHDHQPRSAKLGGTSRRGPDGEKIGKIADIYLDDQTNTPEWLAVSTGLFGSRLSFVPLQGAAPAGEGCG